MQTRTSAGANACSRGADLRVGVPATVHNAALCCDASAVRRASEKPDRGHSVGTAASSGAKPLRARSEWEASVSPLLSLADRTADIPEYLPSSRAPTIASDERKFCRE